jgi:hypothetical protein
MKKTIFLKICVGLLVALLQSGCDTMFEHTRLEKQSQIPLESAKPVQHGMVFIALGTQTEKPFYRVTVSIRPLGQGGATFNEDLKSRPHLYRSWFKFEISNSSSTTLAPDATGTVLAAALPPGDYEIFDYTLGWKQYSFMPETYLSIPIHVKAGEALYLGRFVARLTEVRSLPSLIGNRDVPDAGYYEVSDHLKEDSLLLAKLSPTSSNFTVVNAERPACSRRQQYVRC